MQHVLGWFCKPGGEGRGARAPHTEVYSQSLALNPVALMPLKENQAGVIQDLDETLPITLNPFIHEAIT